MADLPLVLQTVQQALEAVTSGSSNLQDPLLKAMLRGIKTAQEMLPIVKNFSCFKDLYSYLKTSNKCSLAMAFQLIEDTKLASFLTQDMIEIIRKVVTSVQTCSSNILDVLDENVRKVGRKLMAIASTIGNFLAWLQFKALNILHDFIEGANSENAIFNTKLVEIRERLVKIPRKLAKIQDCIDELKPDLTERRFYSLHNEVCSINEDVALELTEIQTELSEMEQNISKGNEKMKSVAIVSFIAGAADLTAFGAGCVASSAIMAANPFLALLTLLPVVAFASLGKADIASGLNALNAVEEGRKQVDEVNILQSHVLKLQKELHTLSKKFFDLYKEVDSQRN